MPLVQMTLHCVKEHLFKLAKRKLLSTTVNYYLTLRVFALFLLFGYYYWVDGMQKFAT
jgi:hypothetical protein